MQVYVHFRGVGAVAASYSQENTFTDSTEIKYNNSPHSRKAPVYLDAVSSYCIIVSIPSNASYRPAFVNVHVMSVCVCVHTYMYINIFVHRCLRVYI